MKPYAFLFALLAGALAVSAQKQVLSVGNTTSLTIKTGTIFSADSMVLIPGADLTLASNTIQESASAVNLAPAPGINKQYNFGSQISFTGTLRLYYQPSELNGNAESTLEYTDSAAGGAWLPQASSTVNTSLHFVQYVASGHPFIASTASGPPINLAISLVSFTANWNQPDPLLSWVVAQSGETVAFNIESSVDGANWNTIGTQNGQDTNGLDSYQFSDANPSAQKMYYRLELVRPSGQTSYSNVVYLQKGANGNSVILVAVNNTVSVRFSGTMPGGIRLINAAGQILRTDMTSRPEYQLYGVSAGVYFLQYELNGQWAAREFVIY